MNRIHKILFILSAFSYGLSLRADIGYNYNSIEGFPEGCAYASIAEALPDHQLRYGFIRFIEGRPMMRYLDEQGEGPFLVAEVADNLGLMGQDPEENLASSILVHTPRGQYVIAQVMDRSEYGLDPIVTCISPLFTGRVVRGILPYGDDYHAELRRAKRYVFDDRRRHRWNRWKGSHERRRGIWRDSWRRKRMHLKDNDDRSGRRVIRIKDDDDRRDRPRIRIRDNNGRLNIRIRDNDDRRETLKLRDPDRKINIRIRDRDDKRETLKLRDPDKKINIRIRDNDDSPKAVDKKTRDRIRDAVRSMRKKIKPDDAKKD